MHANQFYDLLIEEVEVNPMELSSAEHKILRYYYRALASNPLYRDFYRHNWIRRTAPMVDLLKAPPKSTIPIQILDAGCGVGTEALFWSLLRDDVEVIGVDIAPDRLKAAQARKEAYQDYLGRAIQIQFIDQDVFDVLNKARFHMIWVMEAISHIDPAEDFISIAYRRLIHGGFIVISESHRLNPAIAWEDFQRRRRGTALRTTKTTSRGKTISYAQERLFSTGDLSAMLRRSGFDHPQTHFSIYYPPMLARYPRLFTAGCKAEEIIRRVPVIRYLGGIYTIVARKSSGE